MIVLVHFGYIKYIRIFKSILQIIIKGNRRFPFEPSYIPRFARRFALKEGSLSRRLRLRAEKVKPDGL
jgi:hypothetical protein